MAKPSGNNSKRYVMLEAQTRQVRAATESVKRFMGANEHFDRLLNESAASARATAAFMQGSRALKNASKVAESLTETQNSLASKLKVAYSENQLEAFESIRQATQLAVLDSGVAARTAALFSQFDTKALSKISLPRTELVSETISRLMQELYSEIETDYPVEAGEIKQKVDELNLTSPESASKNLTLNQALVILTTLMTFFSLCYSAASYYDGKVDSYNNKEFQEQLLSSQTEILGQMYELNSHILSAVEAQPNFQSHMTEYVVLRPVNLRTKHSTGKESHIIAMLMPNQRVELLKQGEPPNKKWIYIGYQDHIEGIPRTGWVYKKYLKRL